MRISLILVLAMLPALAGASEPKSRISDKTLADRLNPGQTIVGRADGDLNGDGLVDTAYVVGSDEARIVRALLVRQGAVPGYRTAGTLDLGPKSLGPPDLSIANGVLKVEDLTGGTTAVSSTYRFRLDPMLGKMRLIGLDATLYSRTLTHDAFEISWNLLNGDVVTQAMRVNKGGGDEAYDRTITRRFKRPSKPLTMENAPDPETALEEMRKR